VGAALRALDVDAAWLADAAHGSASTSYEGSPPGLHRNPSLRVHADEVDAARFLLQSCGIEAPTRPLVMAPGARYGAAKRYPLERFAVVAAQLGTRLEAPCVLVGGAGDAHSTRELCERLPASVDLTGRTDLGTLLGVLSRARGVVSNDSGVMHLAAALGTPVLGIFGSTNPSWTRPLGAHAGWVSHPVPCAPCYRRTCPIDFPCMLGLDPQVVVDKFLALVALGSDDVAPRPAPL
jgi:heptosyltransferase-2